MSFEGLLLPDAGVLNVRRGELQFQAASGTAIQAIGLPLADISAREQKLPLRFGDCWVLSYCPDGCKTITAMPMRAIPAPAMSQRVNAIPSTRRSHTSATAMYTPPYAA